MTPLPPWRRWEQLLVAALVLVPFVHAVAAWGQGWLPLGDNANQVIRTADVGTRSTPLVGMPSGIVGLVVDSRAAHPGPLPGWVLGPWVRFVGTGPLAVLLGSAVPVALGVGAALWSARRVAGRRGLVVASGLLALVLALVPFQLVQPLPPALALVPALAALIAAAAVASGDRVAAPVLVVAGSFAIQADVVYGPVIVAAAAAAAFGGWRRRTPGRGGTRALLVTGVALAACWAAPALDIVIHGGGNLSETIRTSNAAELHPQGWPAAVGALRADLHPAGWLLWATAAQVPSDVLTVALGLIWVVGVGWCVRRGWPDRPPALIPLLLVTGAAVAGAAAGMAITPSNADRNALYLAAVLAAGFLATFTGVLVILGDRAMTGRRRTGLAVAAVGVAVALLATRAVVGSNLEPGTSSVPILADAALARVPPGPVLLVSAGGPNSQSVLRGMGVVLQRHGFDPCYPPDQDVYVGARTCEVDGSSDRLLLTRALRGPAPDRWIRVGATPAGGSVAERDRLRGEVADQLRERGIELTHQASDEQIGEVLASTGGAPPETLLDEAAMARLGAALRAEPARWATLPDAVLATMAEEGVLSDGGLDTGLRRSFQASVDDDDLVLWLVPADAA